MLDAPQAPSPIARDWNAQGNALPYALVVKHYIGSKDRGATAAHFQCTESAVYQIIRRRSERGDGEARKALGLWSQETVARIERAKENRRNGAMARQAWEPSEAVEPFEAPRWSDDATTQLEALCSGMEQLRRSRAKVIEARGANDPEAQWLLQQWLMLDRARRAA